jgi:hypothetical protein
MPAAEDLSNRLDQEGTEPPVLEMMVRAFEAVRTLEEKSDAFVVKLEELDERLGEAEARLAQFGGEQDQNRR